MKRRQLILMLGGSSAGAMTIGSGAFSSAQMERGVNVSVVDDESAFVGYETPSDEDVVSEGDKITLVEVRNRFGADQEIAIVGVGVEEGQNTFEEYRVERKSGDDDGFNEVEQAEIVEGSPGPEEIDTPESGFGPGGRERIRAKIGEIDPDEEIEIVVTITVKGIEGTGVTAQLFGDTRSFTIKGEDEFTADEISNVNFPGNSGNAQIRTGSNQEESGGEIPKVDATAYYTHDGDVKESSSREVKVNTQLELDDFGVSEGDAIVGISVNGIEDVYVHPKFNDESCEVEVGNSGGGGTSGQGDGGDSGGETAGAIGVDEAFGDCFDARES